MRIQTNVSALSAQNKLAVTQSALQTSTTRLSSGFRINRAADDAAGLSIANQMRGDIRSLQTAQRNASQAGSMLQIADGATGTIASILDRMKELATQAASDNTSDSARGKLQDEFSALQQEIDRIVQSTNFQGKTLLDGSFGVGADQESDFITANAAIVSDVSVRNVDPGTTFSFAVVDNAGTLELTVTAKDASGATIGTSDAIVLTGAAGQEISTDLGLTFTLDSTAVVAGDFAGEEVSAVAAGGTFRVGLGTAADSEISLSLSGLGTQSLGIDSAAINLESMDDAVAAITALDSAYGTVNTVIGQIGAATNRLEFASTNLSSIIQNTMAAESTIRDADMAYEMMQFSKQNILAQAGTAMLAQANSLSQSVLQLLR